MADPITQSQTEPSFSPLTKVRKPCSIMCLIIVILAAFVLGGVGGYLLGQIQIQSQYPLSPTINNLPLSTAIPTPDLTDNWKSYTSEKIVDYFKPFKLYYPASWLLKIEKGDIPARQEITLTKNSNIVEILQAPGSEATCLFPEDPDQEGMFVKYETYVEIPKTNNILWRRVTNIQTAPEITYKICEKRSGEKYFQGVTSIGLIILRSSAINESILGEFDEILKRLEILE